MSNIVCVIALDNVLQEPEECRTGSETPHSKNVIRELPDANPLAQMPCSNTRDVRGRYVMLR